MSIQSNVNQGISLVSLLASQTPMAAAQREKAVHSQQIKTLRENVSRAEEANYQALALAENAETEFKGNKEAEEAAYEVYGDTLKAELEARERLFREDPTAEDVRQLVLTRGAISGYETGLAEARETADQKRGIKSKTAEATKKARENLAAEQERIAASNEITRSLDISNIDERALPRLERAYRRAQRDTKYLSGGKN